MTTNPTTLALFHSDAITNALATPELRAWPEDEKFHEAPQAAAIGAALIATVHRHLLDATVAYVFRPQMATHDRVTLAKASKAAPKLAFYCGFDLCIDVNHEAWVKLTDEQKVALIDHELCHFGVEDTDEGTRFVLLSHDVEEFGAIVSRWGLWKPDLAAFGVVCAAQTELFSDSETKATVRINGGEEMSMAEFAAHGARNMMEGIASRHHH